MKRVLFLAYHFPPVGGAGVQRAVHFARHLPMCGYEPVVITGPGGPGRWTPSDESLAGLVPDEIEVRRVPKPTLQSNPARWRRHGSRWLNLPDAFGRWWVEGATAAGLEAGREAMVILATMSPYESAFAAARLSAELGCPWVADLRDPWALDEMQVYATALHRRNAVRHMRRALRSASVIVMNTPDAAHAVRTSLPELRHIPIIAIPNGFDPQDFQGEAQATPAGFRIVHTGYLHTELGQRHRRTAAARRLLRGEVARVDILTRSHLFLLQALDRIGAADPDALASVELHLAGVHSEADRAHGNGAYVRWHGYMPHEQSVDLVRSADLLFLPMHDLPAGHRARIIPGKTYEYLASRRPILAAVPDGDARDLLMANPDVWVCRPHDVEGMTRVLHEVMAHHRQHGRRPDVERPGLDAYERTALSAQLARALSTAIGDRGPVNTGLVSREA